MLSEINQWRQVTGSHVYVESKTSVTEAVERTVVTKDLETVENWKDVDQGLHNFCYMKVKGLGDTIQWLYAITTFYLLENC